MLLAIFADSITYCCWRLLLSCGECGDQTQYSHEHCPSVLFQHGLMIKQRLENSATPLTSSCPSFLPALAFSSELRLSLAQASWLRALQELLPGLISPVQLSL